MFFANFANQCGQLVKISEICRVRLGLLVFFTKLFFKTLSPLQKVKKEKMPLKHQSTKSHKTLKINQITFVGFCVFVLLWRKLTFWSGLNIELLCIKVLERSQKNIDITQITLFAYSTLPAEPIHLQCCNKVRTYLRGKDIHLTVLYFAVYSFL